MKIILKVCLTLFHLVTSLQLCCGTVIESYTAISVFGDVPEPGKLILFKKDLTLANSLKKANVSFDRPVVGNKSDDNLFRIFVVINDFQVEYDLPIDANLLPKIILPDKCFIFVSAEDRGSNRTNGTAIERININIQKSRDRLVKLINIGSIDSLREFENICRLRKEFDILKKDDLDLVLADISAVSDKNLRSEVSELEKTGKTSRFGEILKLERERSTLGAGHPKIKFINKVIALLQSHQ